MGRYQGRFEDAYHKPHHDGEDLGSLPTLRLQLSQCIPDGQRDSPKKIVGARRRLRWLQKDPPIHLSASVSATKALGKH